MANYTLQLCSESGSFSCPEGDDIRHATSRADVSWYLDNWADKHDRVGSDSQEAYAVVFKGRLDSVQDIYPDYIVRIGPRGGHLWEPA